MGLDQSIYKLQNKKFNTNSELLNYLEDTTFVDVTFDITTILEVIYWRKKYDINEFIICIPEKYQRDEFILSKKDIESIRDFCVKIGDIDSMNSLNITLMEYDDNSTYYYYRDS